MQHLHQAEARGASWSLHIPSRELDARCPKIMSQLSGDPVSKGGNRRIEALLYFSLVEIFVGRCRSRCKVDTLDRASSTDSATVSSSQSCNVVPLSRIRSGSVSSRLISLPLIDPRHRFNLQWADPSPPNSIECGTGLAQVASVQHRTIRNQERHQQDKLPVHSDFCALKYVLR